MLQKCNKTCMTCCKLACAYMMRAISQENKTGHNNNKYVKKKMELVKLMTMDKIFMKLKR